MFGKTLITILAITAAMFLLTNTPQAQQVVTDGLVVYWSFNEEDIDGEVVKDALEQNDGVMIGNPQIADGKYGKALEFDGASYVEVEHNETLELWEAHTLEAWIYQKESRSSRIIDKIGAGTADGPHLDTHPGTTLRSCAGGCVSAATTYTLEEWHHVALTYDEGEVKIYLNGSVEGEGTVPSPLTGNELSLKVAADSNGQSQFVGIIDEVRVYNRALSEEEVNQNMLAEGMAVEYADSKLTITWGRVKELQ